MAIYQLQYYNKYKALWITSFTFKNLLQANRWLKYQRERYPELQHRILTKEVKE